MRIEISKFYDGSPRKAGTVSMFIYTDKHMVVGRIHVPRLSKYALLQIASVYKFRRDKARTYKEFCHYKLTKRKTLSV